MSNTVIIDRKMTEKPTVKNPRIRSFVIDAWVLLLAHLQVTSKNPIFVTIPRYLKRLSSTNQVYAAFNFLLEPCLAWQRGKQASCEAAARKIEFSEAPYMGHIYPFSST